MSALLAGEHTPGAESALGITREYCVQSERERAKEARKKRWRNLKMAGKLLPNEHVAECCQHVIPGKVSVPVVFNAENGAAHYQNLKHCGSVWICPICSALISQGRREELVEAVNRKGFSTVMVTLTLQHTRNDRLVDLRSALNDAYRRLKSGRWWQNFQAEYGLVASVAASEITWGEINGWHYHKHILFFFQGSKENFALGGFKDALVARYTGILARAGKYASDLYGVSCTVGHNKIGEYASKWGLEAELTMANVKKSKGGYGPFQLLDLVEEGKSWAGALFVEYAQAMKGHNQLVWSRGGRVALGLGEEKTDEDLVDQEDQESVEVLANLDYRQFSEIVRQGKRGEVLDVAGHGDLWRFWEYLRHLGITPNRSQAADLIFMTSGNRGDP